MIKKYVANLAINYLTSYFGSKEISCHIQNSRLPLRKKEGVPVIRKPINYTDLDSYIKAFRRDPADLPKNIPYWFSEPLIFQLATSTKYLFEPERLYFKQLVVNYKGYHPNSPNICHIAKFLQIDEDRLTGKDAIELMTRVPCLYPYICETYELISPVVNIPTCYDEQPNTLVDD